MDSLRLTSRELVCTGIWGESAGSQVFHDPGDVTPLASLEHAVASGLGRPPCLVSFSGGRDSSLVLAVATSVARRERLPLPIPITLRFRDAPATYESDWQERLIRHLGLDDWLRLEFTGEHDLVGPVSSKVLFADGVGFPMNAHLHLPLAEEARGGTVLTGYGGDDVFHSWQWGRAFGALFRRVQPEPRDALRIAHLAAPWKLRRVKVRRRALRALGPWLRTHARAERLAALTSEARSMPRRWDRWLPWFARRRYLALARERYDVVGALGGAAISHPLLDPGFLGALARSGKTAGWLDRTHAMTSLFSEVLPEDFLRRSSKAYFDEALWGPASRRFIQGWDGSGVDSTLVDIEALRAIWQEAEPHASSAMLLQSAWLATEGKQPAPQPTAAPAT